MLQSFQFSPSMTTFNNSCLHLEVTHKLAFILGLFVGLFVLRHQFLLNASEWILTHWRGYEYDDENQCIVERSKSGKYQRCREPIDCQMCHNVTQIDVVHEQDMNEDLFMERYAYSGRPLLVKNATNEWSAMNTFDFEFFRDLFEDLNSPVLDNEEEDCQFFAWDFKEFSNVQEIFDMPESRWRMLDHYQPWYVGWANCDDEASAILRQFYETPPFLPPTSGSKDWIFIGTPGYGAPFHLDSVKYPSWQAQIHGTKTWKLRAPPECYWTCHGDITATMEPGDVIVVNTNWWYHSTSVEKDLSITITNEYQ